LFAYSGSSLVGGLLLGKWVKRLKELYGADDPRVWQPVIWVLWISLIFSIILAIICAIIWKRHHNHDHKGY
jgi:hypothetical protein